MPLSKKALARIKVLEITAGWIEDQTGTASSDTLIGDDGEYDQDLVSEASKLSKKLFKQAAKIKQTTKE
jgi:hypothetical protein